MRLISVCYFLRCTYFVHEAKDLLHIRTSGRDTGKQGIFVAPQQFIHSACGEETRPDRVHPDGHQVSLPETPFQFGHYSLETGNEAERRRYGKECRVRWRAEVIGMYGGNNKNKTQKEARQHTPLSPTWSSTCPRA